MAGSPDASRRHPRHRLVALREPVPTADQQDSPGGGSAEGARDGPPAGGEQTRVARSTAVMSPALDHLRGRLVRRWLPAGQGGRLDPGRRGALALAAVVLLAAAVAGAAVWRGRPVAEPAPALAAVEVSETTATGGDLVVSVAGPVARPGLVRLRPGARVADAIDAAGGTLPGTDLTGTNLARRLTDGEHVVVASGAQAAGAAPGGAGSRVDLNTATLAELDTLPGVGPVTAQRIIDWRAAHGRFSAVEQLREIEGIGETRFARLKDLVMA